MLSYISGTFTAENYIHSMIFKLSMYGKTLEYILRITQSSY